MADHDRPPHPTPDRDGRSSILGSKTPFETWQEANRNYQAATRILSQSTQPPLNPRDQIAVQDALSAEALLSAQLAVANYKAQYGHIEAFRGADANGDGKLTDNEVHDFRQREKEVAKLTGDDQRSSDNNIDYQINQIRRGAEEWQAMAGDTPTREGCAVPPTSPRGNGRGG